MTSWFFSTVLSCVISALLACSLTILLMRNTDLLTNNQYTVRSPMRRTSSQNDCYPIQTKSLRTKKKFRRVLLRNAAEEGAVCLDGSPPGYILKRGHGSGQNNWIIHFDGGAWCYDEYACYQRSNTEYGSSQYPHLSVPDQGLYSDNRNTNSDFYNWNMVFVFYCDGSSFTGIRAKPVYFKNKAIYFRGKLIMEFVVKDLLNRGVQEAKEMLLVGSSAGSLAVLFHSDYIKSKVPSTTKVRAVADSGFFADLRTHYGVHKLRDRFRSVLVTHNSTSGLHQNCIRSKQADKHWMCMFPQYFFNFIQTPVFVLQSAYDVWQIINALDIACTIPRYDDLVMFSNLSNSVALLGGRMRRTSSVDEREASAQKKKRETQNRKHTSFKTRPFPESVTKKKSGKWHWQGLYGSPVECTMLEIKRILNIRVDTLDALKPVMRKKGSGLFLSPCLEHTQARYDKIWEKVNIKGKTVRQAISDWYSGKNGNHFHIGDELSFASCLR